MIDLGQWLPDGDGEGLEFRAPDCTGRAVVSPVTGGARWHVAVASGRAGYMAAHGNVAVPERAVPIAKAAVMDFLHRAGVEGA